MSHRQSSLELVALVGAPNSGKTTLYNWLTNSKFKTVNYPGATVEYALGVAAPKLNLNCEFMDTPGTYSLFPKSSDEEVTLKALYNREPESFVQKVVCVVDGSQLERHLLLTEQLSLAGFPLIVAITMKDLLQKNKMKLDLELLQKKFSAPVVLFDGVSGDGLENLAKAIRTTPASRSPDKAPLETWTEEHTQKRAEATRKLAAEVKAGSKVVDLYQQTARIDRWLLHPVFGLLFFFLIMSLLFGSIFWMARPIMNFIDFSFTWAADWVFQLAPQSLWADFIGHGLIASFGAVSVFAPQIFILFFCIGIIESTGYLARAATLIDKPFSKIGLSGRSFVPILSGFACAVPAMMATRNISSRRDRMITNFIIPLMSCSARLPVYALLLNFLFKDSPAWVSGMCLAGLYMGSLLLGTLVAGILHRLVKKSGGSLFMMELPMYRRPRWKVLVQQSFSRTKSYLFNAGPVIFAFTVIIWAGMTFPNYQSDSATEKLTTSYMARIGHFVEPVFEPMGVDWRVGASLLSAFAAREVFVSTLAVIFNVSNPEEKELRSRGLIKSMHEATMPGGQLVFTPSSVVGLIVFFMLALQCSSTVSVAIRESGSVKFALVQLFSFTTAAYILSVVLVQGLRGLGIA